VSCAAPVLTAESWKPIDPAQLALKAPVVDPNADAEVLFWEIGAAWRSKLRSRKTTFSHYIRLKVFTEHGRESQSIIDIPFSNSDEVSDVAARAIRADGGTIQELAKDSVYERTIKRPGRADQRVKSFRLLGVEAGSIIEYRYQVIFHDFLADVTFLLQREIPVQSLRLSIRPILRARTTDAMRSHSFHCKTPPLEEDGDGSYVTTLSSVPAFREEPDMPPEAAVRPWLLVYYSEDKKRTADKFWQDFSRKMDHQFKEAARVSDAVRKAAADAASDASAPELQCANASGSGTAIDYTSGMGRRHLPPMWLRGGQMGSRNFKVATTQDTIGQMIGNAEVAKQVSGLMLQISEDECLPTKNCLRLGSSAFRSQNVNGNWPTIQ